MLDVYPARKESESTGMGTQAYEYVPWQYT